MKGMGNMNKLLKQAKAMQAQMLKAQDELAEKEIEVSAGGGAVTVRVNGVNEILAVKIDPEAMDPDDVETLEDLIVVAVNNALAEIKKQSDELLSQVTGGMGGMPGMPF